MGSTTQRTRPTPGRWRNNDGLVNGMDSRARFSGTPSGDIFYAGEWSEELSDEAYANAELIAAAGTVADQLYDAGLDGIEAVKALPELIERGRGLAEAYRALCEMTGKEFHLDDKNTQHGQFEALLARLRGEAE